jgi:uncharacterized protein YjbI with pentapeptide repeats
VATRGRGGPSKRSGAPERIDLPATLEPFGGWELERGGDYDGVSFEGLDLGGQSAEGAAFLGCRLAMCKLDGVSLARARLSECLVTDPSGSSLDVADGVWREVVVSGGRLGALTGTRAEWIDVRLRGMRMDYVVLPGAKLRHVALQDCMIEELDLGGATVEGLALPGSTIGLLVTDEARLADADLRGADIRAVRGVDGLRGAVMSPEQVLDLAPALAAFAGIAVRRVDAPGEPSPAGAESPSGEASRAR